LLGHVARTNAVWRDHDPDLDALVVFQASDAYITPNWYATKRETHEVVPTWNYAVVHAYGVVRTVEDHATLRHMLEALVDTHEAAFAQPWRMDLPHDYLDKMMRAVVGFEIEITRLEGKLKLSQNRSEHDQHRVAEALGQSENPLDLGVAALMGSLKV
jgi:transcriptional regulator